MANAKQVLDVQVSKGITAAQGNEHLRNRSKEAEQYAMSKGNYDPTRKHLNFEIVPRRKGSPHRHEPQYPGTDSGHIGPSRNQGPK